jgi:hypothetical protein
MNRHVKLVVVTAALIVGVLLVSQSRASVITSPPMTLGDWAALGAAGYQQQDKNWVFKGSTLDPTTPIMFTAATAGTVDIHTLTINSNLDSTGSGKKLHYTIAVTTPNNGGLNNFAIVAVSADSNVSLFGPGSTLVAKTLGTTPVITLSSVNGGLQVKDTPPVTLLDVQETWTITGNGFVSASFNSFTEAAVPEPTTLLVWSGLAAIAGVAAARRRKQASGR